MKLRRHSLVYVSLMATSVGVFMAGAHLAANALIDAQRQKQLHEFNEVALRRSEVAVDYGIVSAQRARKTGPDELQRRRDAGRTSARLPAQCC